MPKSSIGILLAALALLMGCASGSDGGFAVEPSEPVVRVGEQLALVAQPQEDGIRELEWEVQEIYGGGFTHSRGLRVTYVAPSTAGKFHLVLHSVRSNGAVVRNIQEIRVIPVMTLVPAASHVSPSGSQVFAVKIKGLSNASVTWSVEEANGGSIQSDGRYTAPQHAGTYHVLATSTVDPEATVRAEIRVD